MIRRVLPVLLLLSSLGSYAQLTHFGNEWIDYDARYWSFKIGDLSLTPADRLYRIDSTALANAGLPLATLDARTIQLFAREKEVPIYFPGDTDGVMNATDFIEFHATGNDAWLDSVLWEDPAFINNPYKSHVNDTLRYFITFGSVAQGKRVYHRDAGGYNSMTPRQWLWAQDLYLPNLGTYSKGKRGVIGTSTSMLGEAEGWFGPEWLVDGNDLDLVFACTLPTLNPFTGPGAGNVRIRTSSASSNSYTNGNSEDHRLRVIAFGNNEMLDTSWGGYKLWKLDKQFPNNLLTPNVQVKFEMPHGLPGLPPDYPDRQRMTYVSMDYPHATNFSNETFPRHFYLPNEDGDPDSRILWAGLAAGTPPVIYVWADSVFRITGNLEVNGYNARIPALSGADSTHLFVQLAAPAPIIEIRPVTASGYFTDYLATNVDSALLIVTHPRVMNGALAYAQYRNTSPVNSCNTLVADVNELYDQYGGGIYRHPMAVRRFVADALDTYETKPKALFIIGKGIQAARTGPGDAGFNSIANADTAHRRNCLVPSFGYPPSDMLLTLGLSGDPWDATVPVGRLAALNDAQVLAYLDKVQELEVLQQTPEAWMKNVLHFRGGLTESDFLVLENVLTSYKLIAEDEFFDAQVTTFRKEFDQNNELVFLQSQEVYDKIEEGVTLMTFAAHAFAGGFDFTIDQPENYNWTNKYPMVIGNSCYTGNIHLANQLSGSELFVLPPNAGAIAYLAAIDLGEAWRLQQATSQFYRSFIRENYGGTIGDHIHFMDSVLLSTLGNVDPDLVATLHQYTLHGDPTIVLNSPSEPDLEITNADVRYLTEPISADADSFQVELTMRNIGRSTNTPFPVAVERYMEEEGITIPAVVQQNVVDSWEDQMVFTLPVLADSGGTGNNELRVRLDMEVLGDPGAIDEFDDEFNNQVVKELQVTSGDILPVEPYNFAITPDAAPVLKASTGDPFAAPRNYVFQIDTIDTYDSPLMQQATINAPGGVVEWAPPSIYALNLAQDSTVFYWRCSIDSTGNDGYEWHEFSFQYVPNRTGWGQAHHMQFKPGVENNSYSTLNHDRPGYDFDFDTGLNSINVATLRNNTGVCYWRKNLLPQEGGGCQNTMAIHLAVIDDLSFAPWTTQFQGTGLNLGAANNGYCGPCVNSTRAMRAFQYRCNTDAGPCGGQYQLPQLAETLDSIPDGHYILLYTYKYIWLDAIQAVAPQLFTSLGNLGATQLASQSIPDSCAYVFFCQKGNDLYDAELWSLSNTEPIDTTFFLPSSGRAGTMVGPRTCEALEWNSLHWEIDPETPTDSSEITVNLVSPDGLSELPGFTQVPAATTDSLQFLDIGVNAQLTPKLRLSNYFVSAPTTEPRPAQTKRLQIVATPAPECAIDPPSGFFEALDSLYEGESGRVMVAVRNISNVAMDSVRMTAWITDANNVEHRVYDRRRAPLPVGGVLLDTIVIDSSYVGLNMLKIEANGINPATGLYDQPEQFHFNNIATLRYATLQDVLNPVLDVTFDGTHILDGDIVSAQPEIMFSLDDENLALIMDDISDTANMKIFLREPGTNVDRQLRFMGPSAELEFIPASAPENICRVRWNPRFARDGEHLLRVRATDESANPSASNEYRVRFEVINRPTITEVLNYPNPFTTSTRFVFELTGRETPTAMRIRIMTIGGRVVREIGLDELGTLRIGRNVSEYAWDGRDQFGDKLARGVYLYQVIAQLHGEDIEVREKAGSYFTKGFGKMYLLQ